MTIQNLLEMGYSEDTELTIYDEGTLYNVYVDPPREGLEKLGVFYYDGLYVDKE